jgi:hypothetical protein
MKKIVLPAILVFSTTLSLFGQLNSRHNHYRPGDVLVKQQVGFVDPGPAGNNVLWDFSRLELIDGAYTLNYSLPPMDGDSVYIIGENRYPVKIFSADELVVGTEHNTMYFFRQDNNALTQLGHENPTIRLSYTKPLVLLPFPLDYGQGISSAYSTRALYSATIDMQSTGSVSTVADARGQMILPTGDTLGHVLRVKTEQLIIHIPGDRAKEDSLQPENKGDLMETCRWYAKGYRYPVFETIRTIHMEDSTEVFSTAFYFPPQEHHYLDTDADNLALLEELWDLERIEKEQREKGTAVIGDWISCRVYPNPVEERMTLEYELKEKGEVGFELYTLEGFPVKKTARKIQPAGSYRENIDCSNLAPRNYVLRISVNHLSVNKIITKK